MKRDLISTECCYAGDLPDYYADADGLLQPEKRSRRARAYRADLKQLQRWFVILIVVLLTVAFGARYGYERMVERKDAEIEAIKAVLRGPVTKVGCTDYTTWPRQDVGITEACVWTVYSDRR